MGDPRNAHDETRIRDAARLGGAEEFIDKMNEGFDTYLDRPVRDFWFIPDNTKTRTGITVDRDLFREAIGRAGKDDSAVLSGGQMQRLAVWVTQCHTDAFPYADPFRRSFTAEISPWLDLVCLCVECFLRRQRWG